MPEILSQSQIDELLSELSDGGKSNDSEKTESSDKKIKEYDFRSPKKLTREQKKSLLGIFEIFARHLASYLSGVLRAYCEINVTNIEEQPYFEYNNSLPDINLIGDLEVKPIEGIVLVDISNSVTYALIERLLGGACVAGDIPVREFTEIEIRLMEKIYRKIAEFIQESFSHALRATASLKQIDTNARLIQTMGMDEVVVIVLMDVSIKTVKGTIGVCMPSTNIESVLDQIGQNQLSSKRTESENDSSVKKEMSQKIRESFIEADCMLGSTTLTLGEINNLQVGDVIKLDQKLDDDVEIHVNKRPWFYGNAGVKKNRKVVKISKVI